MTLINTCKKIFCLFFLINLFFVKCQTISISEIDILQKKKSKIQWNLGNYEEGVILQKDIITKSKIIGYKKGEIRGYLELSKSYFGMNMLKQGLFFLNVAEKQLKHYDDNSLKSLLYFIYGMHNHKLGGHQLAIINFNKSLDFAFKIEDKKLAEKYKQNVYEWKRSSFQFLNQMDSVYSCEKKCMASPKPMLFITIANRNLEKGRIDSAEYYINKAHDLVKPLNAPMEGRCNVLMAYGKLYVAKKEYAKSLKYLFNALTISKKMKFKTKERESYKLIYEAYKGQKNLKKETEYLYKYASLNDSLNEVERKVANLPIESFLKEQTNYREEIETKSQYLIASIILSCLFLLYVLTKTSKKKKEKTSIELCEKEKEIDSLKKKVDENRQLVLDLATKNDPTFIIKFKEVYSDFYKQMLEEHPELNINDMKFIALVKLLFSNKEIATYTNVSIRTVESKKYRIRKKLNLDANIDFNEWIINK